MSTAARNTAQLIPGRPYSFLAALETGRTSWTAVLDAVRLGPADDATAVTAAQLHGVINRLITAGHWKPGEPSFVTVADTGYDITRLAYVLADLPVELVGRLRSDRVWRLPKPARAPAATGRPPKHGPEIALDNPATWPIPQHTTSTETTRYGTAVATSWDRVHPRLAHRGCWIDHDGDLPVIEGTLIRLQVEHLPGDRDPKPVWLWTSITDASSANVDRWWQGFLRRFDLEHTFRLFKQTLGWTAPKIRTPAAADRCTWLGHRWAHPASAGPAPCRRPAPSLGTPRRPGPAHPRQSPPGVPEHPPDNPAPDQCAESQPTGPGRPLGSRNRHPATSHDVGKTVKPDRTVTARRQRTG